MPRSIVLTTLALATFTTLAPAQVVIQRGGSGGRRLSVGGPVGPFTETPASFGVTGWQVGQWARYSIVTNAGPMPITQVRTVTIVGRRGDQYWVELQEELVGMGASGGSVRKMLIPFGVVRERLGTETYVLGSDSSVLRQTLVRAGRAGDDGDFTFPEGWQRVGEESVQVTAGTLRAMHWRKGPDNLWTSADAGPLGIVKYESGDVTVELGSKGADGRSRIPFGG